MRTMSSVRSFLGALLCCLVLTATVPSVSAAESTQAQTVFAEGRKLFAAGDYRGALTWFKNGYTQTKDPAFLLNMAQCHRSLGEGETALEMFRSYLKSPPEQTTPATRDIASKAIKELESAPKAASVVPVASSSGRPGAASPPVAPAAAPSTADPSVRPPLQSSRKFQMAPNALPVLDSPPETEVTSTKAAPTPEPVDHAKVATTVRRLRVAAMACGGLGLLSSGLGIYYWTRARSLSDSANNATVFDQGDYDDGKRAEKMQWIFYGVGGAALATGVGLWVYSMLLPPEKSGVSVAPMVGPATAGLMAGGVF